MATTRPISSAASRLTGTISSAPAACSARFSSNTPTPACRGPTCCRGWPWPAPAWPITTEQLVPRWKSQGWQPAGQLLMAGNKVYFKTNNDLTCWDASATKDDPVWRSAWLNTFELDTYSQTFAQMYQNMGQTATTGG